MEASKDLCPAYRQTGVFEASYASRPSETRVLREQMPGVVGKDRSLEERFRPEPSPGRDAQQRYERVIL